jgi:hypothetical protein
MYEPALGRCFYSHTTTSTCPEGNFGYPGMNFYEARKTAAEPDLPERPDRGTNYNGVSRDSIVSYFKLDGDDGALINIAQI